MSRRRDRKVAKQMLDRGPLVEGCATITAVIIAVIVIFKMLFEK